MDIEESKILLKDFQKGKIEKDKLEHYRGGYKMGYFYTIGIQEALETVLEELENKQDNINILQAQRDSMEYQFNQAISTIEHKNQLIKLMALAILNYDDQLVINRYKDLEHVKETFEEILKEEGEEYEQS